MPVQCCRLRVAAEAQGWDGAAANDHGGRARKPRSVQRGELHGEAEVEVDVEARVCRVCCLPGFFVGC